MAKRELLNVPPDLAGGSMFDNGLDIRTNKIERRLFVGPADVGSDLADGGDQRFCLNTVSEGLNRLIDLGGGTLHVAEGALANSETGYGILVRGDDPGVGGTGWIDCFGQIHIEGVPSATQNLGFPMATISPKGGTWATPALWIAGGQSGFSFRNINFNTGLSAFPAVRTGLSSTLPAWSSGTTYAIDQVASSGGHSWISLQSGNTNHTPASSPTWWARARAEVDDGLADAITAFVKFFNCNFQRNGAGGWPAYDAGFTFWQYFEQIQMQRFFAVGGDTVTNCGMRFYPGEYSQISIANYLLDFKHIRCNNAGILHLGGGALTYLHDVTGENMVMSAYEARPNALGVSPSAKLTGVTLSDSSYPYAYENLGSGLMEVDGCGPGYGPNIGLDPAGGNSLASKNQAGVTGIISQYQEDTSRRTFGPASSRYPNISSSIESKTNFVDGPDGLPASARSATTDPFSMYLQTGGYELPQAGDVYVMGQWVMFTGTPNSDVMYILNGGGATANFQCEVLTPGCQAGTQTLTPGDFVSWTSAAGMPATGQWGWVWGIVKVISAPAGSVIAINGSNGTDGQSTALPFLCRIPAADGVSINEAGQIALHASATMSLPAPVPGDFPLAPAPGSNAFRSGQKIAMRDDFDDSIKYASIYNGAVVVEDAFNPDEATDGLVVHFDAAAGVTSGGGKTTAWANQAATGSAYDVAQATGANQPDAPAAVAELNGELAIHFPAINKFLTNTTHNVVGATSPRSVLAVVKAGTDGGFVLRFGSGGTTTYITFYNFSGARLYGYRAGVPWEDTLNPWNLDDTAHLLEVYYDVGGTMRMFVDGVGVSNSTFTELTVADSGTTGFSIGNDALGLDIWIANLKVYDRVLNHDERAAWRQAMTTRYFAESGDGQVLYLGGAGHDADFTFDETTNTLSVPTLYVQTIGLIGANVSLDFAPDEFNITTSTTGVFKIQHGATARIVSDANGLAFFAGTTNPQQTVTGSRGGNAALADLLTKLALYGLIVDGSS